MEDDKKRRKSVKIAKKATKIAKRTYKINFSETGELDCLNTFFKENEFINLLKRYFTFSNFKTMKIYAENVQNNLIIKNSDLIVWAKLK